MRSIFLFLLACSVHAETLTGRVVGIADGDTITVLDANHQQYKIRLSGIDAPEKGNKKFLSMLEGNRSPSNQNDIYRPLHSTSKLP